MDAKTSERVDLLVLALNRQAQANDRLAAALEAHNAAVDVEQNGPRG
ncbi:hypothetical protein [Mycolicibacterium komossense]|uniref:HNH endonuclease n=1 Tax=Mycolicibacterium komossense TaxID=1779 RepID=A0ABT3C9D4_9MYCO|nr:hypothetical protein [Mycolicibacterium komossense]MCV7226093.1 hypothetical protein [Mycolicibacterium komossense]